MLEIQVRAVETGLLIAEVPVRSFVRIAGISKNSGTVRGSLKRPRAALLATPDKLEESFVEGLRD